MKAMRLIVPLLLATWATGCSSLTKSSSRSNSAAKTPKSPDAERFLADWNANAAKIQSLRCDSVDIDGDSQGQYYSLSAKLAYERGNRVRLMGNSVAGAEIDFGSNEDELWFWVRRMKPAALYFCKRAELGNVKLPTPFHPDWIVEALGVMPIDGAAQRPGRSTDELFTLVSDKMTPNGQVVTKQITVDRQSNRVYAFQLYDAKAQPPVKLAQVLIEDYHEDPRTGVFVPRKLVVEWPDAETKLTLTFRPRKIDVNQMQAADSRRIFGFPKYDNTEVVDLSKLQTNEAYGARKQTMPRQKNPGPFEGNGREIQPTRAVELIGTIEGPARSSAN